MNRKAWRAGVCLVLSMRSYATQAATVSIDCDAGGTIGTMMSGLRPGDTLLVSGTCKESVLIPPEAIGITLNGQRKAIIQHPTNGTGAGPAAHAIYVRGRAITITGFTVSNGNDGIHLSGPAQAVIDVNIIINNKGRGIHLDKGSIAQIVNNTIQDNGAAGINVAEQSHARIGFLIPPDQKLSPNTIQGNGGDGIHVERSASAWIVGNAIRGNTGNGVAVDRNSQADVVGNLITGNRGDGIAATHASSVNLVSESTPRGETANRTDSAEKNAGVGISCSVGGYVAGPLGGLIGTRGAKAIDSTCTDRLIEK